MIVPYIILGTLNLASSAAGSPPAPRRQQGTSGVAPACGLDDISVLTSTSALEAIETLKRSRIVSMRDAGGRADAEGHLPTVLVLPRDGECYGVSRSAEAFIYLCGRAGTKNTHEHVDIDHVVEAATSILGHCSHTDQWNGEWNDLDGVGYSILLAGQLESQEMRFVDSIVEPSAKKGQLNVQKHEPKHQR